MFHGIILGIILFSGILTQQPTTKQFMYPVEDWHHNLHRQPALMKILSITKRNKKRLLPNHSLLLQLSQLLSMLMLL